MPNADPDIGRRVESLRRRAGLTRDRLAALAGLSPTTIKFIENDTRTLTIHVAQKIAPHLGVRDLGDLYGPAVTLSLDARPSHPAVNDVRKALTAWHVTVAGQPETPEYLRGAVDAAWRTWHTSPQQRTEAGAVLPDLLAATQRAVRLHSGNDRRTALTMLAQAYHLGQAFLAWHGDRELVWLCVDRGMSAALDADDPLAIAQSIWYAAHLLRAVGRSDEALQRLAEARALIEPRVPDGGEEYAETLADLYFCTALTKARAGDQGAWADLSTASDVVTRALPEDFVGLRTRVSRALVEVYAVMCAVDLGQPADARRRADALDPASIPSTERRARHFIELARSADMEGGREASLHMLTRAEATSSDATRYSPAAADIIRRLATEGPASIRSEAAGLAQRLGVEL